MSDLIDVQISAATPTLRAGLAALLHDPRMRVTVGLGEASPPESVLPRAHVIADDARLSWLAREAAQGGDDAIIALTDLPSAVSELASLNVRGWAVLPPGVDRDDLIMAVVLASRGLVVIPSGDAGAMPRTESDGGRATPEPLRDPLTPREQEVLELLVLGLPNKIIGHRLDISESTVKYHVSSIYAKLGAASRADAVSRAARAGLVTL